MDGESRVKLRSLNPARLLTSCTLALLLLVGQLECVKVRVAMVDDAPEVAGQIDRDPFAILAEADADFRKEPVSQTRLTSLPTPKALEEFVYDWLEMEHPGWENNDGADGTCSIDLSQGSFTLEHTDYYTESDTTESTL